ncbi:NAD(P)-dependent oxidoreductase [Agrococcus casei]|uniref:NAD(P)-dependent oxidoreductase n=1 Tax=Agrococcus casei TaxID=343512 RepID=UPI003F93E876
MAVILATSRSFGSGDRDLTAELAAAGHTVLRGPSSHEIDGLREALGQADAWVAGTGPVTAEHLDASPGLKVVARYGVGTEAVDVAAARERGIVVTNTPGANSDAVADHTVALILTALRSITAGDRGVRSGDWSVIRGRQLGSQRVGLVGFGRIGRGVAQRLSGFGSSVIAHDPFLSDEDCAAASVSSATLETIGQQSDIVSLHAPGGQTVVDAAWLAALQHPIVLVNTARPDLIDEDALAAAMRDGVVRAFAADTLQGDTAASSSPLLAADLADRVTVTPHFGAQTVEAVDGMGSIAVDNALAVLDGRVPPNPVR